MDDSLQGMVMSANVSAANTVKVVLANNTAGAINLANANLVVWVEKRPR
jgi:hypothetical protein